MELTLTKQITYLENDKITALCQVNASMSPKHYIKHNKQQNKLFYNLFLVLYLLCYSDFLLMF